MNRVPIAISFLAAVMFSGPALADEVVDFNTRPGVKQSVLILEPNGPAKGVVLMFPGHEGVARFVKKGDGYDVENEGGGFTAKKATRDAFLKSGFVAALVAPPTGKEGGMDTVFRSSAEHAADIAPVISYLRRKYGYAPILHGHCRSTFSPASIATRLKNEGVAGLVLTSPRSDGRWGSVTDYEPGVVTVPVLLVQHTQDTCPGTLYRKLDRVVDFYKRSSSRVDVILVSGGNGKGAGNKCQNGFHGFAGLENATAAAIANWMLGRDFPRTIHD